MKEAASVWVVPGTEPLRTHPAGLALGQAGSASSHTSHGFVLPHGEQHSRHSTSWVRQRPPAAS